MKHTKEELINALNIIIDECAESKYCEKCPFYRDGCAIRSDTPSEWNIVTPEEPVAWRAFK